MSSLRDRLASIPDPDLERPPQLELAIASSVRYLGSDAAQRSLDADSYWPKWDSPWWHMVLLWELGDARRIPQRAVAKMVEALDALRVKIFPIHQHELPADADPHRDVSCHCAVGSIHQVLGACGVDVDTALPWIPRWLVSYQMADGGLNCDSDAYLVTGECPSSMVATVPVFEALLARGGTTTEERRVAERAAAFLVDRRLIEGSRTTHNAAERTSATEWLDLSFPRFYLYDVLRGLSALVRWADLGWGSFPLGGVETAIEHLVTEFPDGVVRPRRRAYAVTQRTFALRDGAWIREPPSTFPLLEVASVTGEPSAALTRQWSATRRALCALIDDERLAS
jgi:hypothetical protein